MQKLNQVYGAIRPFPHQFGLTWKIPYLFIKLKYENQKVMKEV